MLVIFSFQKTILSKAQKSTFSHQTAGLLPAENFASQFQAIIQNRGHRCGARARSLTAYPPSWSKNRMESGVFANQMQLVWHTQKIQACGTKKTSRNSMSFFPKPSVKFWTKKIAEEVKLEQVSKN